MQRSTMQEAISAHQVGGIVRLTKFILKTSIFIELIGAALLMPVFCKDFGILKGLWYSLFHAVSAFCNAGFDLIGVREPFFLSDLLCLQSSCKLHDHGLDRNGRRGLCYLGRYQKNKLHFKKYNMQSKVILTVTAVLITVPAVYFFSVNFPVCRWGKGC